jgi:hypothetical protein
MIGQTTTLSRLYATLLLTCLMLLAACAQQSVHGDASRDSLPPMRSPGDDRHVLAGEWEYAEGFVVRLTLDEQGNGRYPWKDGRIETLTLIGHTWHGMWFQKENDREGGFTVELSPDFSEGEGRWWVSRVGGHQTASQKGGTFHLSKKTARKDFSNTSAAP